MNMAAKTRIAGLAIIGANQPKATGLPAQNRWASPTEPTGISVQVACVGVLIHHEPLREQTNCLSGPFNSISGNRQARLAPLPMD